MPRGRPRKQVLGDSSVATVNANILLENPEGVDNNLKVVVADHIPETRRVVFNNQRDPGQPLSFHYHTATHPLKMYTLYHGKVHELPAEVIEHLESCAECIYEYGFNPEKDGRDTYIKGKRHYFSFRTAPKQAA